MSHITAGVYDKDGRILAVKCACGYVKMRKANREGRPAMLAVLEGVAITVEAGQMVVTGWCRNPACRKLVTITREEFK